MSRELTDHKVNGLNEVIRITVLDEPGPGGANHLYALDFADPGSTAKTHTQIKFQNGPIGEVGVNGVSNEALLAVLIDRMRGFQNGPYKSRDNACALTHMEEALMWLNKRTRDRVARGVEGTMKQ